MCLHNAALIHARMLHVGDGLFLSIRGERKGLGLRWHRSIAGGQKGSHHSLLFLR